MEPYQAAAEENRRQGEIPFTAAKKAGSLALTAGSAYLGGKAGGLAFNKIAPFLSKYIPEDLAIKGLNKIDPRFGEFINKSKQGGKTFDEIKDFISKKMESQKKPASEEGIDVGPESEKFHRNIIEQYSPELNEFLMGEIKKGKPAKTAAGLAAMEKSGGKNFKKIIQQIVNEHKMPWDDLVEWVYGMTKGQKEKEAHKALGPMQATRSQAALQPQQMQQAQPQQKKGLSPEMQAALNKIMQM